MHCPKDKNVDLVEAVVAEELPERHCPDCEGNWISATDYQSWQERQPQVDSGAMPKTLDLQYARSPLDTRGALCPECSAYLARAKVELKTPFYIERCVKCGGIWCDRGEWEVLQELGLHTIVDQLFYSQWQAKVRERHSAERERQAIVDKLGEDLANRVFELAELLETHPSGDFGVAYLMRRFDK